MSNILGPKRIKALHDAVNLWNRYLTRDIKSDRYDYVPSGVTYDDMVQRIHSVKDYNAIIRFLHSNDARENPRSRDIVLLQGQRVPRYVADLMGELGEGINDRRLRDAETIYPGFNELSPVEKAAKLANVGLNPLAYENYGADKLNIMFNERFPNCMEKAEIYIQVWEDWGGDSEVPRIIRELAEKDPDRFVRIMDSDYDQKEIHFIYPSHELVTSKKNERGWVYNVQSADESPMSDRQARALQFWLDVEAGLRV